MLDNPPINSKLVEASLQAEEEAATGSSQRSMLNLEQEVRKPALTLDKRINNTSRVLDLF